MAGNVWSSLVTTLKGKDSGLVLRACGFVYMAWIASSDGDLATQESEYLHGIGKELGSQDFVEGLIELGAQADQLDLAVAGEVLRKGLTSKGKEMFFQVCAGLTLADGVVRFSEMYILHAIVDLFVLSPTVVEEVYQGVAARPFPWKLGDTSRQDYWRSGHSDGKSSEDSSGGRHKSPKSGTKYTQEEALAVLGLKLGATQTEIKSSFRRLTVLHHPDKFEQLGPEAVAAANVIFMRIKAAYEQVRLA